MRAPVNSNVNSLSRMANVGEVYFTLRGNGFDPDSLSLGIKPASTKHEGNPTPKLSSWNYSTGRIHNELIDVYELASSLVADLSPHVSRILEAKEKHSLSAVLEVVLFVSQDHAISPPSIGFDEDVIGFLYKVGASIDIDSYRAES